MRNMKNNPVANWLMKRYLSWQQKEDELKNINEFAEYLGVSQPTLSMWLGGSHLPSKHSADLLAAKLGPEIYDLLGLARPDTIPMDQLPQPVRDRLAAAIYEVNSELESRGLSGASPEAENITMEIFEKHGFRYTYTINK